MKLDSFNYEKLVNDYSTDPEVCDSIKKYEELYSIDRGMSIEQHPFYKEYLAVFNTYFELITPDGIEINPQDLDLIIRLVMGSFSTAYNLELDEEWKLNPSKKIKVHLRIFVESEGASMTRLFEELHFFQVDCLFDIFVKEQIELQIYKNEEEEEAQIVSSDSCNDDDSVMKKREERCNEYKEKTEQLLLEAEFFRNLQGII